MTFAKLDSGIIRSSIWAEPLATRVLWITMLALKDENGFVSCARSGLQRCANISVEEFDTAIKALESPDLDSRTPDYDGCRVAKIDGGWVILNHEKYRLHDDIHREKTRERVKKFRENHDVKKNVTQCNVTDTLHSVSVSESVSKSEEKSEEKRNKIVPPKIEWVTEYCNERKNNVIPQKWYDFYQSKNWMIGKNKMKDWQAAVRTWEQSNTTTQNNEQPKKKNTDFKYISPYDMEK